jgi:hypothetical protein
MSEDTCPIRFNLRGLQGVCPPRPAHYALIATFIAKAGERDRTAAIERAQEAAAGRRNRVQAPLILPTVARPAISPHQDPLPAQEAQRTRKERQG